ncbi:MAG: aldehyde dehydrogenase family protein [Actinophytocola sp.]|uniref:aldehyde dehydrogenase family protein n=1 Tax=Actinophytocola sp. TaxID=1872138 RepID=UPI0013248B13|nr:aldehyde dehydrogenase family protein [Actinophytocola sp.]MPZ82800.1 aldehyde dehydrogenase family protein [Actinophytocola sp.]
MNRTIEGMYVGGQWLPVGADTASIAVRNPSDSSTIAEVSYGGSAQATAAADAAAAAFDGWANQPARARSTLLLTAADLLDERAARIGRLLATETGKRLPEGVGEIAFAAEFFRWFGHQIRQPHGELLTSDIDGRRQLVVRRPAGVAVCLTPWNFPVSIQARKIAAALAAGCTTVSRASEKAPLAVVEMFRCLADAGFPAGVVNLVQGPAAEVTEDLLAHPAVRVVSFTGSTGVGKRIMRLAADRVVRPALELGGDAAFVVCQDADVDAAVEDAMVAKFRNNGQSCIAANRFLVHEAVYHRFRDALVAKVDAMTIGDPLADPVPDLGPLIDDTRVAAIRELAEDAEASGAKRLTAEREAPPGGSYLVPSLWDEVPDTARLATEEAFGPVAALFRFGSDDEAIARANATEMGLASYVYTKDNARAWRYTEELDAGIIGCNTPLPPSANAPLGGVKQSGLGREGGSLGIEEFTVTRYAAWQL